ncbi:MFS transporter [Ekhidna sp. To15]|uniref:MFS transporter n=1 Tax=Ekhidna sp. To15 TaxID=3395267 RepID=UPI003F51B4F9
MSKTPKHILPIIVLAQFFCTSLWFAGNAVMPSLASKLDLISSDVGYMTSSVQFGFIVGTLFYALLTIADRFHPSNVFFISALLGAGFNACIALDVSFVQILTLRFLTGFFLAGIYPVGMKIAADYYEKGLGKALSFLVGALVLGTALPHLIASYDTSFDWKVVILSTSALAVVGGFLIKMLVGEGPYRKQGQKVEFREMRRVFRNRKFRAAAFGYFGHMWELYAFWAFVPFILRQNGHLVLDAQLISMQSFMIIAVGALACFLGGYISEKYGAQKTAFAFLLLSGLCCLFSPLAFNLDRIPFLVFMIFWGMVVIADSPLFSSLVAQRATPELKGTALTLVNNIGFTITIFSIQLLSYLIASYDAKHLLLILAAGPAFGLISLWKKPTSESS